MDALQRREFHEALLDADGFDDLPGEWQAAILAAERNRPDLRVVNGGYALARELAEYGFAFAAAEVRTVTGVWAALATPSSVSSHRAAATNPLAASMLPGS